ncbi:MAG: amidohydrolase, partial [Gammaproteobacteria bacterium]|nr:amidohydrolase [Gammaproteobacteria bacterium]
MLLLSQSASVQAFGETASSAKNPERTTSAPVRDRGDGPYSRLILRGGTYVSGEGAPPLGPV